MPACEGQQYLPTAGLMREYHRGRSEPSRNRVINNESD
jgi:hypothetical protein